MQDEFCWEFNIPSYNFHEEMNFKFHHVCHNPIFDHFILIIIIIILFTENDKKMMIMMKKQVK